MKNSASCLICTSAVFFGCAAKPAELKMDSARKATAATVVRRKDGTALIEIPFLDVWHARPGTPRRLHHRHRSMFVNRFTISLCGAYVDVNRFPQSAFGRGFLRGGATEARSIRRTGSR